MLDTALQQLNFIGQFVVTILLSLFVYLVTTTLIALGIDLETRGPVPQNLVRKLQLAGSLLSGYGGDRLCPDPELPDDRDHRPGRDHYPIDRFAVQPKSVYQAHHRISIAFA